MCSDLVGPQEIGQLFGVSRARVAQLVNREDFPEPLARLGMGAVWREQDVRDWAGDRGRAVYDRE